MLFEGREDKPAKVKDKKPKRAKEEKVKKTAAPKNKKPNILWRLRGLIFFILICILLYAGITRLIQHVDIDVHTTPSYYRGTIIDGNYCCYLEESDEIVVYSTSKGPHRINNTQEEYETYMEKLRPADTSEDNLLYFDEVKKAMGKSFDDASYKYIDGRAGNVLFYHKYEEGTAIWLYTGKTGQVDMLIDDPDVKGIAYANDVVYTRNEATNETVCYRVSTSYSRQLISVEPFEVITTNKISFWYMTVLNFAKGLINGLKASQNTR